MFLYIPQFGDFVNREINRLPSKIFRAISPRMVYDISAKNKEATE
jgi:hypothetical protein